MSRLSIEERQALGRVIAVRRIAHNLTQEKLAAAAGVPIRSLQRAERGDGIGQENLDAVASALEADSRVFLAETKAQKGGTPDLRLKMPELTSPVGLVSRVRRARGVLQIGPEGEHSFNEHIGGLILEMADCPRSRALREAAYALAFSEQMGFRLFCCHYHEELEHKGRMIRKPTTLIIAAPFSDPRIRKTSKGYSLDYIIDRRKQLFHRILKGGLTAYDWMEDRLISKTHGEERVRAELFRIHQEIIAGLKPPGSRGNGGTRAKSTPVRTNDD